MIATIDREGRISLGQEFQDHLGVHPGDEIVLEIHGNGWLIKAAKAKSEDHTFHAKNIEANDPRMAPPVASTEAELFDDTGRIQIAPRDVRTVLAKIVAIPRRLIPNYTEE